MDVSDKEQAAQQHYDEVTRNMAYADIERIEAGNVTPEEQCDSIKMAAGVAAWHELQRARSGYIPAKGDGNAHHPV